MAIEYNVPHPCIQDRGFHNYIFLITLQYVVFRIQIVSQSIVLRHWIKELLRSLNKQ